MDPDSALTSAFVEANTALMVTDIRYMKSGTTCVVVYMKGNKCWVANCGDSRAVMASLVDGHVIAENLTRDHKPDDVDEEARIREWGIVYF
jgi:serine/threonine protein phosphatase PrpC